MEIHAIFERAKHRTVARPPGCVSQFHEPVVGGDNSASCGRSEEPTEARVAEVAGICCKFGPEHDARPDAVAATL